MKVLLLLSGGTDSSRAAKRLLEDGYYVVGLCINGKQGEEIKGAKYTASKLGFHLEVEHINWFNEKTYNPIKLVTRDIAMVRRVSSHLDKHGINTVATGVKKKDLLKPSLFWLGPFLVVCWAKSRLRGVKLMYPVWNDEK